jgi:hypothetical protein
MFDNLPSEAVANEYQWHISTSVTSAIRSLEVVIVAKIIQTIDEIPRKQFQDAASVIST